MDFLRKLIESYFSADVLEKPGDEEREENPFLVIHPHYSIMDEQL